MMSAEFLIPAYGRQPVGFVRGSGSKLWDAEGNEYLDAIAGVAVTNLGHCHPAVSAAIVEQATQLLHTSNMFAIPWQNELGLQLSRISGLERTFFCNSGAEANETALKIARLDANTRGIPDPKVLVMEGSFHGRTFATLAATGNPGVQRGYEPLVPGFVRSRFNDIDHVVQLANEHPSITAVLLEPVQGEGGVRGAGIQYLKDLRSVCDERGWLMILDEIQTGMGRTGHWFRYQEADILPDVVTLAKGLGNGVPIGACLARGTAATLISPGMHGSTFGGNPLACRVGCAVIGAIEESGAIAMARILGQRLEWRLIEALADCENVVDIRSYGLMVGIELRNPVADLVTRALQEQALVISVTREKVVRLLPSLLSSEEEIDQIAFRLGRLLATQ